MSALRFRSWMPLVWGPLLCGVALAGCGEEPSSRDPGAGPEADLPEDPEQAADPGQRFGAVSQPKALCSRALPGGGDAWKLYDGPPEQTRRQVAATAGASFVVTDHVVKRRLHGGSDFETVHAVPGKWMLHVAASQDRVFVVTEEGIFSSTDDGVTFNEVGQGVDGAVSALRASATAVVATSSQGHVARWDEDDGSWTTLDTGGTPVMLAASDGATTLADTGKAVIRSQAAGAWAPVVGLEAWGYRDLVVAGDRSVAVTVFGELRASADAGATFSLADPSTEGFGPATRVATAGNAFIATTTSGAIRSIDGGTTWALVAPASTTDNVGSVAAFGESVIVATPAVRTSDDGGATFSMPVALRDATIVSIADVGPWRFVSTADHRIHASYGEGGAFWQEIDPPGFVVSDSANEGDTSWLLLGQRLPGERYISGDVLVKTSDDGASWEQVDLPYGTEHAALTAIEVAGEAALVASIADDRYGDIWGDQPVTAGIFRLQPGGSWISANAGLPVVQANGNTGHPGVTAMESHDGTVMVLLAGAAPHRSTDFGDSWEAVTAGLDPADTLDRLVASDRGFFAASSAGGALYMLAPGGAAWTPLEGEGLPAGWQALSIAEDGGLLFLGITADDGPELYVSADGGASFVPSGIGAAAISLHLKDDRLFVGARGDGYSSLELPACK